MQSEESDLCTQKSVLHLDHACVSHDEFGVHQHHAGFLDHSCTHTVHSEAVNILPILHVAFVQSRVGGGDEMETAAIRQKNSTRFQPAIASVQDRVQHGLEQQEVAHPLRDDDVELETDKI